MTNDKQPPRPTNTLDQYRLLCRLEADLESAMMAASQLPGHYPLTQKLTDALSLASAWRCDQEAVLPAAS